MTLRGEPVHDLEIGREELVLCEGVERVPFLGWRVTVLVYPVLGGGGLCGKRFMDQTNFLGAKILLCLVFDQGEGASSSVAAADNFSEVLFYRLIS